MRLIECARCGELGVDGDELVEKGQTFCRLCGRLVDLHVDYVWSDDEEADE